MVQSYFDRHLNQLIRNMENITNATTGLKVMPDSVPSIMRDRTNDTRFLVMPVITDTHCAQATISEASRDGLSTTDKDSKMAFDHLDNIVEFAKRFNVDAIAHLGDIVDGKATVASTTADLKKAVGILRAAKSSGGATVPTLIAKGNHDNNALYGRKQTGDLKDDMKYTIKASVLDPILRQDAPAAVVYDKPYQNQTSFTTTFDGFLQEEEYRVLSKLLIEDGRMSARNTTKSGNLDVLDTILTSVTLSSAEKKAWNKFHALATAKRSFKKDETGLTTAEVTTLKALFLRAAKARCRGSYCYIDFANKGSKGIRVIVLDAYDVPDKTRFEVNRDSADKLFNRSEYPVPDFGAFGRRQVEWFAKVALKTTKEVVILCHHALTGTPFTTDGGSRTYNQNGEGDSYWIGNIELMKQIIDDFIAGTNGTHTTLSAIENYSKGAKKVSLAKPEADPGKTKTPLSFYNAAADQSGYTKHRKYRISNDSWVKTEVTTDFRTQGAGTIITICNGHSHNDKMRKDITGAYVAVRNNCSFRNAGSIPQKNGFDTVKFNSGTVKEKTIARKPGTYTQDSWQVMVVDTQTKQVFFHQFGVGQIKHSLAYHVTDPEAYSTDAKRLELVRTSPINIDPRYTPVFPIRRFGYGSQVNSQGVKGMQD